MQIIDAPSLPGLDAQKNYGMIQSVGVKAGSLIFLSGLYAIDPQTGERLHGTVTSETKVIFENLRLLLEGEGSSLARIIQIRAMIYDRIEYDVLNRAYRQYVPELPPARTVWSAQLDAGFKVQLDVIATL